MKTRWLVLPALALLLPLATLDTKSTVNPSASLDRPWPPFDPANPLGASGTSLPAGSRFLNGEDATPFQAPPAPANLRVVAY